MKTLIAIPCMDMVPNGFMTSLINLKKTDDTHYAVKPNSLIYDSRNTFAAHAITKGYDRVLWLDSDMLFLPEMLEKLNADMDENNLDYVAALAFKRTMPTAPVVYSELEYGANEDGTVKARAVTYKHYPVNSLFEVAGTGFGAVLTRTSMLKAVWEKYGPPFQPLMQMGEDLAFCWRAGQMGYKMWCDSRISVGHIGQCIYNEGMYDPEKGTTVEEV